MANIYAAVPKIREYICHCLENKANIYVTSTFTHSENHIVQTQCLDTVTGNRKKTKNIILVQINSTLVLSDKSNMNYM